ncbi:hypothetical protein OS493_023111 [Desmophyllum pertusum]|uniref:Uncharacterized protein n=1 Tax=Desmophyllum pertusum TaxID=174260 RepID=A0A9X0CRQ2_9CNID|nr:hypothetical protein OS493_023111 [Desmophyllum pertusum]
MLDSVDDIRAQLLARRHTVRHCSEAVFLKTKELVSVDQCILETMEDVRKLKQEIRRNEFDLSDLQNQIEETQDELERTRRHGIANKAFKNPLWRLESGNEKQKPKSLNYSEVLEENSYSLGSLGMRSVPLQFDFPCCVASHKGLIYVADRNNCRVLVLDSVGELSREPIEFGNTGPLAIAVNKRGNVIVTDSQIIKWAPPESQQVTKSSDIWNEEEIPHKGGNGEDEQHPRPAPESSDIWNEEEIPRGNTERINMIQGQLQSNIKIKLPDTEFSDVNLDVDRLPFLDCRTP